MNNVIIVVGGAVLLIVALYIAYRLHCHDAHPNYRTWCRRKRPD